MGGTGGVPPGGEAYETHGTVGGSRNDLAAAAPAVSTIAPPAGPTAAPVPAWASAAPQTVNLGFPTAPTWYGPSMEEQAATAQAAADKAAADKMASDQALADKAAADKAAADAAAAAEKPKEKWFYDWVSAYNPPSEEFGGKDPYELYKPGSPEFEYIFNNPKVNLPGVGRR